MIINTKKNWALCTNDIEFRDIIRIFSCKKIAMEYKKKNGNASRDNKDDDCYYWYMPLSEAIEDEFKLNGEYNIVAKLPEKIFWDVVLMIVEEYETEYWLRFINYTNGFFDNLFFNGEKIKGKKDYHWIETRKEEGKKILCSINFLQFYNKDWDYYHKKTNYGKSLLIFEKIINGKLDFKKIIMAEDENPKSQNKIYGKGIELDKAIERLKLEKKFNDVYSFKKC